MLISKQQTVKIGTVVLLLTVTGKIFSFLRELVFSAKFGTSVYSDAYFASNIIPGLLYTPLIGSMLVFFIPLYSKLKTEGDKGETDRFSSNLLNIYVLFSGVVAIVIYLFARILIKVVAPGFSGDSLEYATTLLRISCLSFPVTMATWVYINISNANQKHLIPQLLSLFNSIIAIIAMIIFSDTFGIFIVPISGLFAWLIQMLLQRSAIKKIFSYRIIFDFKDPLVKEVFLLAIPVFIATGIEQINLSINNMICSMFSQGSISSLNYAQKVQSLINGTFTNAIIVVMYPIFSQLFAKHKEAELYIKLKQCCRILFLVLLPISIISILGSSDIIKIIYYRGVFTINDVMAVSKVFIFYSLGILFLALKELYTRIYYIFGDSKTPAIINGLCILVNVVLSFIFIRFIGIAGLALATSISHLITYIFEKKYIEKKFKTIKPESNKKVIVQILSSNIALVLVWFILQLILSPLSSIIRFILSSVIGTITYIFVLSISKNDECLALINLIRKRFIRDQNQLIK